MKVHYDKEQDILYLAFKDGPSHEVPESTPNIVLELDEIKEIMGLEIWNARKIGLLEQVAKAPATRVFQSVVRSMLTAFFRLKTMIVRPRDATITSPRAIEAPVIPKNGSKPPNPRVGFLPVGGRGAEVCGDGTSGLVSDDSP